MTFDAVFDIAGERVDLALPDGPLSLPLAQSASGARYADHRGNEFWTKGDTGTLTRAGGAKAPMRPRGCTGRRGLAVGESASNAASPSARSATSRAGSSKSAAAKRRRCTRNWITASASSMSRRSQPLSGLLGFAGTAADGTQVRLVLERKTCSDGMSDDDVSGRRDARRRRHDLQGLRALPRMSQQSMGDRGSSWRAMLLHAGIVRNRRTRGHCPSTSYSPSALAFNAKPSTRHRKGAIRCGSGTLRIPQHGDVRDIALLAPHRHAALHDGLGEGVVQVPQGFGHLANSRASRCAGRSDPRSRRRVRTAATRSSRRRRARPR